MRFARLLASLCARAGRCFCERCATTQADPDIAGGVHVGKDELDVDAGDQCILFGYAGDETGETNVRRLMIGLGAVSEKAILYEPKLGAVVTTFRTTCFEVETVHGEHLSFSVWSVGGQDKVRLLWRHFYQGTNGLLSGVNSNDRDSVVDVKEELNKMIEDEMRDAVVLALANTLTPSTAARSGKKLPDARNNKDLWWWYADGAGGDRAFTGKMVQTPASGAGIGQADMGCVIGCGRGKMTGGGARHRRNDVSIKHKQPTCHDFGIGECPKEMPVIIGIHLRFCSCHRKMIISNFGVSVH